MHVKSMFVGEQLISMPYAVYGGLLVDSDDAQELLLEAAQERGKKVGAGYVELRHLEERPGRRLKSDLYVTFRKQLPAKVEEVMPGIPKRARAEVRRAVGQHQMTFEQSEDYQAFYQLFSDDKRRLGSPPLPYRWFSALREEFGRQVVLHMVRDSAGKPAAAVMSFAFQGVLYAYYSGSRFDLRGSGVNNFIYCRMMEWAVDEGFQCFDFGRSRKETGAAFFKHNMGFEAENLSYEYLMLRDDATMPEFHPSNPALSAHRRIWSNLPRFVTRRLGGRLSRYLP
jgi:FemAB-related protein (PEP-CTERM system-associated)